MDEIIKKLSRNSQNEKNKKLIHNILGQLDIGAKQFLKLSMDPCEEYFILFGDFGCYELYKFKSQNSKTIQHLIKDNNWKNVDFDNKWHLCPYPNILNKCNLSLINYYKYKKHNAKWKNLDELFTKNKTNKFKKVIDGLYILYNIDKDMYYIGISNNIYSRLKQHFTTNAALSDKWMFVDYRINNNKFYFTFFETNGEKNKKIIEKILRWGKGYNVYNLVDTSKDINKNVVQEKYFDKEIKKFKKHKMI